MIVVCINLTCQCAAAVVAIQMAALVVTRYFTELRPAQVILRGPLDIGKLLNGGLSEPRKVYEWNLQLFIVQE